MSNKAIVAVISAILLTGIGLFYLLMESYQEIEDLGWGSAAYRNPYLAAEQFLQRQEVDAHTEFSMNNAEPLDQLTTLVIGDSRDILSTQQGDRLLRWLEQGGHLIIASSYYYDTEDSFLDRFNVEVYESECHCHKDMYYPEPFAEQEYQEDVLEESTEPELDTPDQTETIDTPTLSETIDPSLLTTLTFDALDTEVSVNFNPAVALYHPAFDDETDYTGLKPFYWEGTEWGIHYMQFDVGDGLLTVTSDLHIWENSEIQNFDHAYLLGVLSGRDSSLTFVTGKQVPSLISLAWRYGPEVFIAFAVWLLFWILFRSKRFVPPKQLNITSRRSLAEHIDAVAHFHWRQKDYPALTQSLIEEINKLAETKITGFIGASSEKQLQLIAKHCAVSATAAAVALNTNSDPKTLNEIQFTEKIQTLQAIRARL